MFIVFVIEWLLSELLSFLFLSITGANIMALSPVRCLRKLNVSQNQRHRHAIRRAGGGLIETRGRPAPRRSFR
jgi:hypothetical protein